MWNRPADEALIFYHSELVSAAGNQLELKVDFLTKYLPNIDQYFNKKNPYYRPKSTKIDQLGSPGMHNGGCPAKPFVM